MYAIKIKRRNRINAKRRLARKQIRGWFQTPKLRRDINYQYSQRTQIMGPGTTYKNFEEEVGVQRNTVQIYDLSTFTLEDDLDTMMRSYKFVKLTGVLVTQNKINMNEEQNSVYVNVDWTSKIEEVADIEKDDATKVLPNFGRASFLFRPPRGQIPTLFDNQEYRYLNIRGFIPCESLYQVGLDNFRIPGRVGFYNKTDTPRIIRVIIRMEFRGSRVLDKVENSKRILNKYGYEVTLTANSNPVKKIFNPVIKQTVEKGDLFNEHGEKEEDEISDDEEIEKWKSA